MGVRPQWLTALEAQLIGQYMRSNQSKHGILAVANADPNHRWKPGDGRRLTFVELTEDLTARAAELLQRRWDIEGLSVVSIDFSSATAPTGGVNTGG